MFFYIYNLQILPVSSAFLSINSTSLVSNRQLLINRKSIIILFILLKFLPIQTDYWANKRFTDYIRYELVQVNKHSTEEGKEHNYVNEVVHPFADQAAKDFTEYIKDYINTEG